jgi:hypothetical protein
MSCKTYGIFYSGITLNGSRLVQYLVSLDVASRWRWSIFIRYSGLFTYFCLLFTRTNTWPTLKKKLFIYLVFEGEDQQKIFALTLKILLLCIVDRTCIIEWNYLSRYIKTGIYGCPWYFWQFGHCTPILRAHFFTITNLKRQIFTPDKMFCSILSVGFENILWLLLTAKDDIRVVFYVLILQRLKVKNRSESFLSYFFFVKQVKGR